MGLTRRTLVSGGIAAMGMGIAGSPTIAAAKRDAACTCGQSPAKEQPLHIQVVLFDGFELTDALAPFDVLKVAEKVGAALSTSLISVDGADEVVALDEVRVRPTARFDPDADLLLVPGAPTLWRAGTMPPGLESLLCAWREAGKPLATVCTGAVFAARLGLLTGRNAVSHQAALQVLEEEGVNVVRARVVDDGDLLSSGGVTSGLDLALYLIERHAGVELALRTAEIFEYERRGAVWKRER